MVDINEEYEKEIKSLIEKFGPHWRRSLESKGKDPRHKSNEHLLNYVLERTHFLDNVETDLKTRVVCCLKHTTEVPRCQNPKCGKPLPKYYIDNVIEEHPRETMFCSHKCIYEARENPDSFIYFDKQYPTKEAKIEFLRKLVNDYPRAFQRILQGHDYEEVAKWIYDAVPKLQDSCYNVSTRLYWILNDIKDFPSCQCKGCSNKIGIKGNVKIFQGYQPYCSRQCAGKSELTQQHIEETMLKTYHVRNARHIERVRKTISKKLSDIFQKPENAERAFKIMSKARKKISYDGKMFASKPELAYYIWLKDNNINFEYHPKIKFKYFDRNGKAHSYFPDFLVNGEIQEIKGDHFFKEDGSMFVPWKSKKISLERQEFLDDKEERKHQCMIEHNVRILRSKDYQIYLDYVDEKYGKNFLNNNKIKTNEQKN